MSKSKDAFRTISEVADWLETPAHVLRFWESKFTQVKPVKRAGGRRYYRPADMQLLGGIKKLLHDDGLTIKGAQKLLREHGVKHVAELSQPLEEDLLEQEEFAEAAYEPDAQAEPTVEEPATVLSFPARAEPPAQDAPSAQASVADTPAAETPVAATGAATENTAPASEEPNEETPEPSAAPASETPTHAPVETPNEPPAFGDDALPAFLRRSPAPKETEVAENAAPPDMADAPVEKVTIDPVARLEPVKSAAIETTATEDAAPVPSESPAEPQQPMFSHRRSAPMGPTEAETPKTGETAPIAKSTIDVPPIAKVAPELDSYAAPSGVLGALPGARGLSPELAHLLSDRLIELRALRDRMQNH